MKTRFSLLAGMLAFALLAMNVPALAQDSRITIGVNGCGTTPTGTGPGATLTIDQNTGNLCINGTISASLGGFTPSASNARMTPLAVTTSDSSGPLPTGAVTIVSNAGSNPMYCNVNGIAATTSDQPILAGSWFAFTIPLGSPPLHCIATGGSTTANGVGGSGLATGAGGGTSSGGGSSTGGGGGLASFQPNGNFAALTAGSSSTQVTAPTGASVAVLSTGSTPAYINLGTSSSVTATSSNIPIAPFSPYVLEMGLNTNIAAIDPTGTSNLTLIGGSDLYQLTLGPIPSGTNPIGSLLANQSVNVAQFNGVTPLMGNGQTGTGAPRVTLSQDSLSAPISISTATATQLVPLSGSTAIYVTSLDVIAAGTGNITFEYGTGTACATGTTTLTGAYNLVAQTGFTKGNGGGTILKVPSGNALCALTSAAVQISGSVSYLQF